MLDENLEDIISLSLGNKLYEMSNHLGNLNDTWFSCKESLSGINPVRYETGVLTVINACPTFRRNIKVPQSANTIDIDGYLATLVSTADYSPFGVQLDERTESAETYRYGYQGSEKDDEVKGEGNSYTTEFRLLDPRLGRWLSIDPLAAQFPWQSPYCSMDNNPMNLNDVFGDSTTIVNKDGDVLMQIDIGEGQNTFICDEDKWPDLKYKILEKVKNTDYQEQSELEPYVSAESKIQSNLIQLVKDNGGKQFTGRLKGKKGFYGASMAESSEQTYFDMGYNHGLEGESTPMYVNILGDRDMGNKDLYNAYMRGKTRGESDKKTNEFVAKIEKSRKSPQMTVTANSISIRFGIFALVSTRNSLFYKEAWSGYKLK